MVADTIEWKDFELSVELHKFYVDFIVKLNLFYYAITGAILSFHFSVGSPEVSAFALLLPIALSLGLGAFYIYASKLAMNLRYNILSRARQLGLEVFPEGIVLVFLCIIFGSVSLLVGFSLIWYLIYF